MPRLRDRNHQIPNGFSYRQPETGWWSRDSLGSHPSFDTLVRSVISHRQGNPVLLQKGVHTDYDNVASEMDEYNALICWERGWAKYILSGAGEGPPPPKGVSLPQRLGLAAAGAETLVTWIRSGAEAVPTDLSASRGSVCVQCPENRDRKLTDIFTVMVSEGIRKAYNQREKWNLSTPHDEKLGICNVCTCPIRLKVHMKIGDILRKISPDVLEKLPGHCWILKERNQSGQ